MLISARRERWRSGLRASPRCQPAELGRGAVLSRYLFTRSGEPQWCYLFLPWLVSRQLLDAGSSAVPAGSVADTAAFHSPAQCPCVCSSKYSHLRGSLGMGEPLVRGTRDGGQPQGCRGVPRPQSFWTPLPLQAATEGGHGVGLAANLGWGHSQGTQDTSWSEHRPGSACCAPSDPAFQPAAPSECLSRPPCGLGDVARAVGGTAWLRGTAAGWVVGCLVCIPSFPSPSPTRSELSSSARALTLQLGFRLHASKCRVLCPSSPSVPKPWLYWQIFGLVRGVLMQENLP